MNDKLSPDEIKDVNESWREIKKYKAKKFKIVNELLKELKRE